jgi:hypothetical protein
MDNLILLVMDCDLYVLTGAFAGERPVNRAAIPTERCTKHVCALFAQDLLSMVSGNSFRGIIPREDLPVPVDGHDPFGDAVKHHFVEAIFFHGSSL